MENQTSLATNCDASPALAAAPGSAKLPREFTLEFADCDIMRADISLREFGQQWKEVRAELIRRGYEVTEWFCEATRQHKARCVLQQNVAGQESGPTQPNAPTHE